VAVNVSHEYKNSAHTRGYVLLVEPDELIRELIRRWLSEEGYAICIPLDPAVNTHDDAPSLIIANVGSPAGGCRVLDSVRAVYAAPVLALSAWFRRGLGASSEVAHRLGVEQVLPIPCTREELLGAVRDAMHESS
jgi:DNA-binding response OmpR family regulator